MLSPQTQQSGFSTPSKGLTADQIDRTWQLLGYLVECIYCVEAVGVHIDEMFLRKYREARALLEEVEGPLNYSNSDIGGPEL